MTESLGTAVLTLTTDPAQLLQGIDLAKRKKDELGRSFDETAKKAQQSGLSFDLFGKKLTENASATGLLSTGMKSLGGALIAGLSIGAVTAAIGKYTEFTGRINDMSAKTGIGTEALQRLKFAAEQNGGSIELVTAAIGKLGNNLAGGNKNAVGALDALGLSLNTIRSMEPDKAFTAIGDAIAKVEDPMARTKLAMDLFGKSGAELLPMMRGNLSETAAEADRLGIVMSDSAVKAGDDFGDTLDKLSLVGGSLINQVLAPMVPALSMVASWLGDNLPKAVSGTRAAFDWIIKKGMEIGLSFQELILKFVELGAKVPWLGEKLGATKETITSLKTGVQFSKDAIAAFDQQTQRTTQTVSTASSGMKALKLDYDETKKATDAAAKAAKEKADILDKLRAASIPLTDAQRALVVQYQQANLSSAEMAKIMGVNVVQVERFITVSKLLEQEIATVSAAAANFAAIFPTQVRAGVDEVERMQIGFGVLREQVVNLRDAKLEDFGFEIEEIPPKITKMQVAMEEVKQNILQNLGAMIEGHQSFGQALSNIWGGIKQMIVGHLMEIVKKHFLDGFVGGMLSGLTGNKTAMSNAFSSMTSGFGGVLKSLTGSVSSAVTGWVGIATAAFAGIKALWDSGFGRGGEEGVVVNPMREKWFAGREVGDIGRQLAEFGIDGETARQMIQKVFDAKKKTDFEFAAGAIDAILSGAPRMALGGLVMRPTFAMVGERGPEAIVPLGRSMGESIVNIMLDGRTAARAVVPWLPGEVSLMVGA